MWRWLLIPLAVSQIAGAAPSPAPVKPTEVSLIAVIANPERFDGRTLRLTGLLNLTGETNALYINKADLHAGLRRNAAYLDITLLPFGPSRRLSGHYVDATGVFNARSNGRYGLYTGVLKVSRLERHTTNDEFDRQTILEFLISEFWGWAALAPILAGLVLGALWVRRRARRGG
jgi:hypothetical protein